MIRTDTLGGLVERQYSVTAHCHGCRHSSPLDLAGLAERLGRDFVAVGDPNPLVRLLRCVKCQGKDLGLIISPPNVPMPSAGHSLSRTDGGLAKAS